MGDFGIISMKKHALKILSSIGRRLKAALPPFLVALNPKFHNRLFFPIFEINMWCHHSFLMVSNQEYGYVVKLFL